MYRATEQFSKTLLDLPETGMGYQIITANRIGSYVKEEFVVYNSNLIIEKDNYFDIRNELLKIIGYKKSFEDSNYLNLSNPTLKNQNSNYNTVSESAFNTNKKGAVDNPLQYANGEDIFVRLSNYENDMRIDFVNNRLKDGTFATTINDFANLIVHNYNPIDRYALPNDDEIKWVFFVQPKSVDRYRFGTVQPAFGKQGGGEEAYFEFGTSINTFKKKTTFEECKQKLK